MKCITIGCENDAVEDTAHISLTGVLDGAMHAGYQCDPCQTEIARVGAREWVKTHQWELGSLIWDDGQWVQP